VTFWFSGAPQLTAIFKPRWKQQKSGDPRRLDEILVDRGSVSPQDVLEALKTQQEMHTQHATESTIRVDVGHLDRLMNRVGELVLLRNQILQYTAFWRHAMGCALMSSKLARLAGYSDPEKAYLAGLLHRPGNPRQYTAIHGRLSRRRQFGPRDSPAAIFGRYIWLSKSIWVSPTAKAARFWRNSGSFRRTWSK
jgi:hypothetical protein